MRTAPNTVLKRAPVGPSGPQGTNAEASRAGNGEVAELASRRGEATSGCVARKNGDCAFMRYDACN